MPLRFLDDNFWSDGFVFKLDTDGKCLYGFCIANPQQKPHGIFEAPLSLISSFTRIPEGKITTLLTEFEKADKIKWLPDLDKIWVKKFIIIQTKNPKYFTGMLACLEKEPYELQQEYLTYYNDCGLWVKYKIDISGLRTKRADGHKQDKRD